MRHIADISRREILLTLAIIVTLITLMQPTLFKGTDRAPMQQATELISSQILLTRQKAIASKTSYRIHCEYASHSLRIYREDASGKWVLDPPDNLYRLPEGVSFSAAHMPNAGTILVAANGRIDCGAGKVALQLSDSKRRTVDVRVSTSGMVQVIHDE